MKTQKIPIKIVVSGKRACGKSVMARYLADMFESLGAEVIHIDGKYDERMAKINNEYYRKVEKQFYKQRITIKTKDCIIHDYTSAGKTAEKYLKKWRE